MFNAQQSSSLPHWVVLLVLLSFTAIVLVGCGDDDEPTPSDTTPPTIVSISPAPGSTNVRLNQAVQVVFSEKMATSTITANTFTVAPALGTVAISADSTTATFTPLIAMTVNTSHTVVLTTGITDVAGNAMAQNSITTFQTGTTGGSGAQGMFTSGSFSFGYLKTLPPIPYEAGTFSVAGVSLDVTGGFPVGINQVCGGGNISGVDTAAAFGYGAKMNPDETVDIGIVVVTKVGGDVTPGAYPVGLSPVVAFVYMEGVTNFVIPPDFDPDTILDWAEMLTYDRLFVSVTGTINVTAVSDAGFQGTFGGSMAETTEGIVFTVSNGTFSMSQ